MMVDPKTVFWYVLFATHGKATKISDYLKTTPIEHFFPYYYKEKQVKESQRVKRTLQPLLGNIVFVKSTKAHLDPFLKEIKLQLNITSDLYYRYIGTREFIVVPEPQMLSFIAIAGSNHDQIIYLSNNEINMKKGTKVRVTGGIFEGVEGIFMRIQGDKRVVVSIPNLLSVATAFIPSRFILPLE